MHWALQISETAHNPWFYFQINEENLTNLSERMEQTNWKERQTTTL